ncbi:AbrB family transcriptional regulator [Tropicimonas sp. IMCC34043]|uniref:AbrB family transcriptional regulator n=1 Tax=Tropicimonas sp. IMCC34043 TaxID=2248760 RepID=UPI000E2846EB|nr:AbrB family transcriptional regulator [Tropicimonas sp. IMCC34043]
MNDAVRKGILAGAIGLAGAVCATLLGLPAAALIGSSIAVAIAATAGLAMAVPGRLRDVAFGMIGISLGAGVQADALSQLGSWSISLLLLAVSLLTTLLAGAAILRNWFGLDAETALLASAPGTMSNAIAIALDGHGDVTAITILQVIRLLVLVAVVPPLATVMDAPSVGLVRSAAMEPLALTVILLLTLGLSIPAARWRIPAASLLIGMILSASAHVAGLANGPAPSWAIFASFVVTGTVLGTRLTSISGRQLLAMGRAGAVLIGTTLAMSIAFACLTAFLTGLPLGQVWIAYAPGGVEAMAAIGLALGYDPAYVATHHFARIVILVILVPILLSRSRRH